VPAALVIGSMVPDLPYFPTAPSELGTGRMRPSGPFTVDLGLGMIVLVVWHFVLYRPLCDFAPGGGCPRAPRLRGGDGRPPNGAISQVILDTFTHPGRLGTTSVGVLTSYLGPLPVYTWFQFGLGAFGLIILLGWAGHWLAHAPTRPVPLRAHRGSASAGLGARAGRVHRFRGVPRAPRLIQGLALEAAAFEVATGTIGLTAVAVLVLCLAWPGYQTDPTDPI
jgi:hypothetical protein